MEGIRFTLEPEAFDVARYVFLAPLADAGTEVESSVFRFMEVVCEAAVEEELELSLTLFAASSFAMFLRWLFLVIETKGNSAFFSLSSSTTSRKDARTPASGVEPFEVKSLLLLLTLLAVPPFDAEVGDTPIALSSDGVAWAEAVISPVSSVDSSSLV